MRLRALQGTSSVYNAPLVHGTRSAPEKGDPRADIENISHAGREQAVSRRLDESGQLFSR